MDAIDSLFGGTITSPSGIATGEAPVWNGTGWARSSVTRLGQSSLGSGAAAITAFLRGDGAWQKGGLNLLWDSVDAGVALPAASVTTPTLDQSFKHLLIVWKARGDLAGNSMIDLAMRVNGLSTQSYVDQIIQGNAASATAVQDTTLTYARIGLCTAATAAANYAGIGLTLLPNYSTAQLPLFISPSIGWRNDAAGDGWSALYGGTLISAGAVSTLTFLPNAGGNLVSPSRFSVYAV